MAASPGPRPWQRQPAETPQDFLAFVAYLRAPACRSIPTAAARSGRSVSALRRLSARFNWPARVAAFDARLAEATQDALDAVLRARPAAAKADFEQLRVSEYHLASDVIQQSRWWLNLASNPRRKLVTLGQLCTIIELAFKLARLATGMPLDNKPRRPRKEDRPGYWTGPSPEEALKRIYGSDPLPTSPQATAMTCSPPVPSENSPEPAPPQPPASPAPCSISDASSETVPRRRDAWSSRAAYLRRKHF